ncbi:MAG: replicative DNA helicase [Anaerolineae bacterium]|nr:replicative DNA helicase [Anaerolineae bacterium]
MPAERLPPQNVAAEQSVLGSILIDPDAIIRIAPFLRPDDFYREAHGRVYSAMLALHERREPSDFVTLSDELERQGELESVGGAAYLTTLLNSVPTAIHVEHYAHIVERNSILRRLIDVASQIAGLAYDSEDADADQAVDRAEQLLFAISERRLSRELTPIQEVLRAYFERIGYLYAHQGEMIGVPSGFTKLDRILGGMQRSDLLILAARPGVGKTSLMLGLAATAARRYRQRVAIFSLEMSNEQIIQRLVSADSGIDSQRLRTGSITAEEYARLDHTRNNLSGLPVFLDDTPAMTTAEFRTKCRRLAAEHGVDLIMVDYLQLMVGDRRGENRVQEISGISRALKQVARELNVPVLAASQLSRAVESRSDRRPILSDLRESGSIEQDADVVMFIYREDMSNTESENPNLAELIVAKHRNGPTGTVPLYFKAEQAQFVEVELRAEALDY